jgi:putative aldouronate transport system permease protein
VRRRHLKTTVAITPNIQSKKKSIVYRIKRELTANKYLYIMALPVILYYLIFHYGTMYGAMIAFKKFDIVKGVWGSPWVGFRYFKQFFDDYYFWRLIKNTFMISINQIIWGFPAPIIFALLLNEIRAARFKKLVQTISYLPHFISTVVVCGMIFDFVSRNGLITDIFVFFGGERTNLLAYPQYFRTIYVGSGIWQEIGWGAIIYLAALSNIDTEQYEAAKIDGAGRFKQLLYVTLPGIMPTIIIMLILKVGHIMSVGYEKVMLLYNPNTYETADIISTYVYRKGIGEGGQFSYSSAVGLFSSVLNFILIVGTNYISKKTNEVSLW